VPEDYEATGTKAGFSSAGVMGRLREPPWLCPSAPSGQEALDIWADDGSCLGRLPTLGEKPVIVRVGVTDVGPYGKRDRILGEGLRMGRSPDPAAVLLAGAGSDGLGLSPRGAREQVEDSRGEGLAVLSLRRLDPVPLLLALDTPPGLVRGVLALRLSYGGPFHQHSLPLIALAGAREFEDHSRAGRASQGAPGQGRVSRGKEHQPVESRALDAAAALCPVYGHELALGHLRLARGAPRALVTDPHEGPRELAHGASSLPPRPGPLPDGATKVAASVEDNGS
jgi:hypothetical protein